MVSETDLALLVLAGPFGGALQLLAVLLVVALLGALYFARAED